MSTDFVPLDLLAEDHEAFAAWDAEHPDTKSPMFALAASFSSWNTETIHTYINALQAELEQFLGREDDDAGRAALTIVMRLMDAQVELVGRGEIGASARLQQLDQARGMLIETLDSRAPTQAAPAAPVWTGPNRRPSPPPREWQLGVSVAGSLKNSKKLRG